jgi:hypothetical protein
MTDKALFRLRLFCFAMGVSYWFFFIQNMILASKESSKPSPLYFAAGPLVGVGALVAAAMLAKRLNRNPWVWGIGCLFLAGILPIVLALLGRAAKPFKFEASAPRASSWGGFGSYTRDKRCSRCGRSVPLTSHAGQSCPFCGAYWSSEETKHI